MCTSWPRSAMASAISRIEPAVPELAGNGQAASMQIFSGLPSGAWGSEEVLVRLGSYVVGSREVIHSPTSAPLGKLARTARLIPVILPEDSARTPAWLRFAYANASCRPDRTVRSR